MLRSTAKSGIATTDITALGFNPMNPDKKNHLEWHRHD
jgi:hypothetical protein